MTSGVARKILRLVSAPFSGKATNLSGSELTLTAKRADRFVPGVNLLLCNTWNTLAHVMSDDDDVGLSEAPVHNNNIAYHTCAT